MVNDSIMLLTISEVSEMITKAVAEAVKPLAAEINDMHESNYTDAIGLSDILKRLNTNKHYVNELLTKGVLGHALYKNGEANSNCKMTLVMPVGKKRYLAYCSMSEAEKQAFDQLGAEAAEAIWNERGMKLL